LAVHGDPVEDTFNAVMSKGFYIRLDLGRTMNTVLTGVSRLDFVSVIDINVEGGGFQVATANVITSE